MRKLVSWDDWKFKGACVGYDPRWWESANRGEPKNSHVNTAKRICLSCPVLELCNQDALSDKGNRINVIRAGVAYDSFGRPKKGRKATEESNAQPEK